MPDDMNENEDESAERQRTLLEELSNVPGAPGHEGAVRAIMRRELTPLADDVHPDGLGSLIARRGVATDGTPRVMIAAHMDEVALMVRRITDEGFLTFQTLGGWLDQAIVNQRWIVTTRHGPVPGVTGIKTVHVMQPEERGQVFKREGLFIDVGAASKADAEERLGILPGDPVTPDSRFTALAGGDIYMGKAWDDRAGLGAMIEVFRALSRNPALLPHTLYGVATVQEEIGLRGAHTSSYAIAPQIGINLESGVAGDFPGITRDEAQEKLGGGPSIFLHDSSMLPNLKLRDLCLDAAAEAGISVQVNVLSGYGEDGAEMQRTHAGAPSINIAVPTRYLHSHNSIIHRNDFRDTVRLVVGVLRRLDPETVERIAGFD